MRFSDIGERSLISRITELLGGLEHDDCAVIELDVDCLVVTTDMLHRETDFPAQATPWQIGWMSAAVNLSDIAAMGAEPLGVLIAAGIPPETDLGFVEEIFRGIRDCVKAHGTEVLGGDTDAHRELTICGTALGRASRERILRRRGARPGDLLCTTGSLGGAGAGLKALKIGRTDLARRLLEPRPRVREGIALARTGAVTAMMDNSDGLALSLHDLAEAGGTGFVVEYVHIPLADEVRAIAESDEEVLDMVLSAGGDFELLFTVREDMIDDVRGACEFTVIGRAVENGIWLNRNGIRVPIPRSGYEHGSQDEIRSRVHSHR
ncbi:MAG TPA: thiamine-phosphate kinase [Methanothrix sp.]|nr:thiamine-phosphate kinase [Methanothrix sp.]HOK58963.1 thiamine-phosphate kinase [Methanothrix sp.]HOL44246.1 thiamine-phosphate kinase [Methanothrix sp.]HPO89224.1 thiamine-phosphate kinase [Methanothrix sp.]